MLDDGCKNDLKFLGLLDKIRATIQLVAEGFDALRIAPRVFLAMYAYMFYDVYQWYKVLEDPSTQQAALMTTIVGFAGVMFGFYSKSGKSWKDPFISWKAKYIQTREAMKDNDSTD